MIATGLKFIHIAAIAIWSAGLICLPFVYQQRGDIKTENDLHRMHAMVRFFYVVIVSPAAFIAIGSGTALIFVQQTFDAWFSVKLAFVGAMVVIHVISGLVILKVFEVSGRYPGWRYVAVTVITTLIVTAILVVVSGKPEIDPHAFWADLFTPGRLGELLQPHLEPFIFWARP
ncbi:CopD family protein [Pelagibacterium lentulum]|uniref:Membrane protein n=1 Tax=Pelagibacterium lentulum TaxID=2029865 RepID=A0A916RB62_9HYPH|nr:CopD family protein [Pelagibacterium lentulum]GGA49541.1 membrane protein [Pelagibacterium lentulum]